MTLDSETPAEVRYGDGDYDVIRAGRFVRCAVTGKAIPLQILRYWSVTRQEAYAGPAEALTGLGDGT